MKKLINDQGQLDLSSLTEEEKENLNRYNQWLLSRIQDLVEQNSGILEFVPDSTEIDITYLVETTWNYGGYDRSKERAFIPIDDFISNKDVFHLVNDAINKK
jgi:hypothetical protein